MMGTASRTFDLIKDTTLRQTVSPSDDSFQSRNGISGTCLKVSTGTNLSGS